MVVIASPILIAYYITFITLFSKEKMYDENITSLKAAIIVVLIESIAGAVIWVLMIVGITMYGVKYISALKGMRNW